MTAPAGEQQQSEPTPAPKGDKGNDGGAKTFTQDQLNAIVAQTRRDTEAKFDGFDDIKAKAEQLDALTQSAKSDLERANETAATEKKRADTEAQEKAQAKLENLRYKICAAKKLDPDLWDRVTGTTKEEIEADADKLAEKFTPARPIGAFRSGASAPNNSDPKERAAAALRSSWENR